MYPRKEAVMAFQQTRTIRQQREIRAAAAAQHTLACPKASLIFMRLRWGFIFNKFTRLPFCLSAVSPPSLARSTSDSTRPPSQSTSSATCNRSARRTRPSRSLTTPRSPPAPACRSRRRSLSPRTASGATCSTPRPETSVSFFGFF